MISLASRAFFAAVPRAALAVLLLATMAVRGEAAQNFEFDAFHAAQKAGKSILVDITASWCPTCRAQKPILEKVEKDLPQLTVFQVDFDTRADVLRYFRVQYQSTLIVFKGTEEIGRSTGDTDPNSIRDLISMGL